MITITVSYSKRGVCTAEVFGTGIPTTKAKAYGWGYSKDSAAAADALNKANVRLPKRAEDYGYNRKKGFKTGGVGMSSILHPFHKAEFCVISREVSNSTAVHIIFKKSEAKSGYAL